MLIGYVCTNFNNSSFTLAAVESLLSNAGHEIEVVVVDNASRVEEVSLLRTLEQKFSCVRVVAHSENVGYFPGLNLGLRVLRERRPDIQWVIAGNNDLEFGSDVCDRIESLAPALEVHSVISPDIVTLEGEHQNPHVISNISPVREFFYDLYYSNYYLGLMIYKLARMLPSVSERADEQEWQTARSIYQGHGSCYLLTPRFFSQFAEFWAPTFMMSEEYFLSRQLKDVGEQVYYEPGLRVVHHTHGSLDLVPSRRRWEMARDAHRQYRKYVGILRRD